MSESHRCAQAGVRRAFTLVETVVVVVIIALLAAIVLVGVSHAVGFARGSAERQVLASLKTGVEQFKNEFGFLPPLVEDAHLYYIPSGQDGSRGPLNKFPRRGAGSAVQPVAYGVSWDDTRQQAEEAYLHGYHRANPAAAPGDSDDRLGGTQRPDTRYSVYSLPFYLMGVLDQNDNSKPIDGIKGPEFTKVREDGMFEQRGRAYPAFYDAGRDPKRLVSNGSDVQYKDRWGTSIRYYRWKPRPAVGNKPAVNLVPRVVGDPTNNPELRDAEFAIVSLGPDQTTNDKAKPTRVGVKAGDPDQPEAADASQKDDIVEVGR